MITQHYESKGGTFQSRLFLSFFPRGLGSESVGRAIPNSSYCGPEWPKLLVVTLSEYSGEGEQDKSGKSKTQELRVVITNQNNNAMKAPMSTTYSADMEERMRCQSVPCPFIASLLLSSVSFPSSIFGGGKLNRISSYYGDGKFSSKFPAAETIMKVISDKRTQRTTVRNVYNWSRFFLGN